MPQPALISTIGRRRFLTAVAAVMGGGVVTLVAGAEGARAAETVTLWRLNANWGYPVGPKDKTHCDCNACQVHAANKIYLTAAAALAGRIHVCCVCQPESFVVSSSCAGALFAFSSSTEMTDRRYPGVGVALASCFASPPPSGSGPSTAPAAAPTSGATPTTPPSAAAPTTTEPTGVPAHDSSPAATVPTHAQPPRATPADAEVEAQSDETLPVTGIDLRPIAIVGGAVAAAGAAAALVGREGDAT